EKYAKLKAERYEYMIRYSAYFDNDKQHKKQIADQQVLYHKMSVQLVELDKHVRDLKNTIKGIGFENPSYFEKAKDLRPTLYDEKVIGLGYTSMFLTHSDDALEIEKFKRSRENKIEFAYDYGNLNASYQTSSLKPYVPNVILEKIIIDLEDKVSEKVSSESENQSENDCLVVEKECDKEENPKVIALGMFKLNLSWCVSPILMSKSSYLDTFSSVRRPKNNGVIWKKKWSSNASNVGFSDVSVLNLNKNVKRYSRKDLLACNNSHLGETRSDFVCNDAMNISCDSRMNGLLDVKNFFIFDDVNVRISPVSKMPFRKKPRDSMRVRSKSNMIKSLSRIVHKWLPKMQTLAEPVAKWFPRIIDLGCSKHMTGNRALLTNFVEKFVETVRFGNNDFAMIAGYGDVVIGSMTINKVYYVEGLAHNLFSVGRFCDKGLKVAFQKSTCFV
nr:integrase, catalytic region, zinc finger, CCHC-type, peptidase aspartic, catalytic [Tanacetum cinerariifolium]